MVQHLLRRRPPVVVPLQHRRQKVSERLRLILLDHVLVGQDLLYRPISEPANLTQISSTVEELLGMLSGHREVLWHASEQFHHLSEVVVVLVVALAFPRFK